MVHTAAAGPGKPRIVLESRSARLSPNTLLVRAWRSLIELRIDDALATISQFEDEIALAGAPVVPRSRECAEVLRAVLLVLKSRDGATVRVALAVLERRHRSGGKSSALAAALRVGYWKVRDLDRYYAVPRLEHAVPSHRGTHGLATIIGSTFEAVAEAEQLRLAVATRLARSAHERAVSRFGKRSPVTARAAVVLADLLYEEGHCAGLETLVMESLTPVRTSGDDESALRGYRLLARLAARRGDTEFAFLILKEAEVLAAARDWMGMMAESLMLRTQLLLEEGRTRDAAICTDRIETLVRDFSSDDTLYASHALARAQVMVANRRRVPRSDDSPGASSGELRQAKQLPGTAIVGSAGRRSARVRRPSRRPCDARSSASGWRARRSASDIRRCRSARGRAPVVPSPRHPAGQPPAPGAQTLHRKHSRGPRSAARTRVADSCLARHGVVKSSRTQRPALDELWAFQQTHRSRAADCPRNREVPRQRHFHQARCADARARRVDGRSSGTALSHGATRSW